MSISLKKILIPDLVQRQIHCPKKNRTLINKHNYGKKSVKSNVTTYIKSKLERSVDDLLFNAVKFMQCVKCMQIASERIDYSFLAAAIIVIVYIRDFITILKSRRDLFTLEDGDRICIKLRK
jgi:hypothetical protein